MWKHLRDSLRKEYKHGLKLSGIHYSLTESYLLLPRALAEHCTRMMQQIGIVLSFVSSSNTPARRLHANVTYNYGQAQFSVCLIIIV